jgi:hypothetical protein
MVFCALAYAGCTQSGCAANWARLHLRYLEPVDHLDGLSGAPVFQVNEAEGNYSTESIAGMILRGTRASMTAYFLEHRRIVELLTEIEEGRVDDAQHPPR